MRKKSRAILKAPARQEEAFPVVRCLCCGWETWCISPAAVRRCAGCGAEIAKEAGDEETVSTKVPDLRGRAVV